MASSIDINTSVSLDATVAATSGAFAATSTRGSAQIAKPAVAFTAASTCGASDPVRSIIKGGVVGKVLGALSGGGGVSFSAGGLLFSGGVNAKSRASIFFKAGFDVIFTSEAETQIQQIAKIMQKDSKDFSSVGKIYYKNKDGKIIDNSHFGDIVMDLDKLPMPAWEMLPNKRYWEIGRPHGGKAKQGEEQDIPIVSIDYMFMEPRESRLRRKEMNKRRTES